MGFMDFFNRKKSGSVAKERLQFMLVSDRASCSPEIMEKIKNDIISVISKYMDIDSDGLDVKIEQTDMGRSEEKAPVIYANIPIKGVKKRDFSPEH